MTDRNGNPLQPATYRGQRVLVDTSGILLSAPPQYNIRYGDGHAGYARCHEVEFDAENPLENNPTEEEILDRCVRMNQEFLSARQDYRDAEEAKDFLKMAKAKKRMDKAGEMK